MACMGQLDKLARPSGNDIITALLVFFDVAGNCLCIGNSVNLSLVGLSMVS
jgi:hypothetical protein